LLPSGLETVNDGIIGSLELCEAFGRVLIEPPLPLMVEDVPMDAIADLL